VAALVGQVAVELDGRRATELVRQVDEESVDFAVVVALRSELAAVLRYFPELERVSAAAPSVRTFYAGEVATNGGGSYRVVVTMLHSMGNLDAAHATSDLIREWNPRFVLVTGIAGGLARDNQDLGDVVVSDSVVYYEPGCSTSTVEAGGSACLLDPTAWSPANSGQGSTSDRLHRARR